MTAADASSYPVRTVLSGPAGGVAAAASLARLCGVELALTLDMGGTSTDVALLRGGRAARHYLSEVCGLPIAGPAIDIVTVGAGGGSILRTDAAGALRVGPESAGAVPGPAVYGTGTQLTVTDANVLLGRIPAGGILGGSIPMDPDRVRSLFAAMSARLNTNSESLAESALAIVNAAMNRALVRISTARGINTAASALIAYGGASGLHACDLADALNIGTILYPVFPGAFSAQGLQSAPVRHENVVSFPAGLRLDQSSTAGILARHERDLHEKLATQSALGGQNTRWATETWLDLRYTGQTRAVSVPGDSSLVNAQLAFHSAHLEMNGYSDPGQPVEVAALRCVRVGVPDTQPPRSRTAPALPDEKFADTAVYYRGAWTSAALVRRASLSPGQEVFGPAIITQLDSTFWLKPGWSAAAGEMGELIIRHDGRNPEAA